MERSKGYMVHTIKKEPLGHPKVPYLTEERPFWALKVCLTR